jgi:hypothetical protein
MENRRRDKAEDGSPVNRENGRKGEFARGDGKGKWEMGNGKWEMGNGRWDMGGTAPKRKTKTNATQV